MRRFPTEPPPFGPPGPNDPSHGTDEAWERASTPRVPLQPGPRSEDHREPDPTLAILSGVVLIALLLGGFVFARASSSSDDYPEDWDPQVEDLAAFVEQTTGRLFRHTVHVELLAEEDFDAFVLEKSEETCEWSATTAHEEHLDGEYAILRALGLAEGSPDAGRTNTTARIAGIYTPDDERIRIRGERITPENDPILVHELVHALQDQQFHLGKMLDRGCEDPTGDTDLSLRSLIEGEATFVETRWLSERDVGLGIDVQSPTGLLSAGDIGAGSEIDDLGTDYHTLRAMAPYLFGLPFVVDLYLDGGYERIREAHVDPPTRLEHVIFPASYMRPGINTPVAEPKLRSGETPLDHPFGMGALTLLTMLAERLEPDAALLAVQGLGATDALVYSDDDDICIRAHLAGDDPGETAELADALGRWAERMPGDLAGTVAGKEYVELTACDPGPEATGLTTGRSQLGLTRLMAAREVTQAVQMRRGLGPEQAQCVSDHATSALPPGWDHTETFSVEPSQLDSWYRECTNG